MAQTSTTLSPGDTAPAFALLDDTETKHSLKDFKGRSLVIYFYPAALTPGCTKQACDFRDNLGMLDGADYAVVGISPDKPAKLAKFRETHGLTFPLLSDPDRAVLAAYGAWGEKMMYGKKVTGVIRSTFVVDPKGKIAHAFYNVKATGHVAKLLRDLKLDS
ncbi:MAG TPA: thioredoxin-dependent thiol peroxidase [Mycobacteriales bacterium]|nr:thioredoxin-dependent thiol peroxidase [Mycobacteriales bacterium]